jgi:hypothetical protein
MTTVPPVRITRDVRLMIASPLKGGAQADYLRSVTALTALAAEQSCETACIWINADQTIDRARNALVGVFLASGFTHLLMVDGDIGFVPEDVMGLIDLTHSHEAYAVLAAACPGRQINWNLVAAASAAGLGSEDPAKLERYSGQFKLDLMDADQGIKLDQPVELTQADPGLMLIRRDVLETLCAHYPEVRYRAEPQDRLAGEVGEWLHALFQPTIDPVTGQYMTGDTIFCYRVRSAGFRLWLAPWIRTTHTGMARFTGSLADLADLETTPSD